MKKLFALIVFGLTVAMTGYAQYTAGSVAVPLGSAGRSSQTTLCVPMGSAYQSNTGGLVTARKGSGYSDGTLNLPITNRNAYRPAQHIAKSGQNYTVSYSGNASYSSKQLHQSGTIHYYGGGASAGSATTASYGRSSAQSGISSSCGVASRTYIGSSSYGSESANSISNRNLATGNNRYVSLIDNLSFNREDNVLSYSTEDNAQYAPEAKANGSTGTESATVDGCSASVSYEVTATIFGIWYFTITYSDGTTETKRFWGGKDEAIEYAKEQAQQKAQEAAEQAAEEKRRSVPVGNNIMVLLILCGLYGLLKIKNPKVSVKG